MATSATTHLCIRQRGNPDKRYPQVPVPPAHWNPWRSQPVGLCSPVQFSALFLAAGECPGQQTRDASRRTGSSCRAKTHPQKPRHEGAAEDPPESEKSARLNIAPTADCSSQISRDRGPCAPKWQYCSPPAHTETCPAGSNLVWAERHIAAVAWQLRSVRPDPQAQPATPPACQIPSSSNRR